MIVNNCLEIDVKFNENDFRPEAYFITSGYDVTECFYKNALQEWSAEIERDDDDAGREIVKQIIQCFKEGVNFKEYGAPEAVKIWNLSRKF